MTVVCVGRAKCVGCVVCVGDFRRGRDPPGCPALDALIGVVKLSDAIGGASCVSGHKVPNEWRVVMRGWPTTRVVGNSRDEVPDEWRNGVVVRDRPMA